MMYKKVTEKLSEAFERDLFGNASARRAILDCFLSSEEHMNAQRLRKLCADLGSTFSVDEIQDTLEVFVRYGIARKLELESGEVLYEHLHLYEHHDHIVCVRCGAVTEIEDPVLEMAQLAAVNRAGFRHLHHRAIIYGLCPVCAGERAVLRLVPLSTLEEGEAARIEKFEGGRGLVRKLVDMGLNPGSEVRVISKSGGGPLIVVSRETRIAIGRGLAEKMFVSPLPDTEQTRPR